MKISIIIPVYNTEKYIERCLESIINQTYKEIEIIIVNDGSTDDSLKIINQYIKKDSRIIVINQENYGGIIARKNGVERSSGEYCLIIDSDDWLELNTIEILEQYVKKYNNPNIIKFRFISEPNKAKQKKLLNIDKNEAIVDKKEIYNILMYSSEFNNIWNSLVKKEMLNFNDSFIYEKIVHKGEDLQINLQLLLNTDKYLIVNDVLYHYYNNPSGITNKMNPNKYMNNILDLLYLNKKRIDVAKKLEMKCETEIIKKSYLMVMIDLTVKLLNYDNLKKDDLLMIENEFNKNRILEFLDGINYKMLKINYLKKVVCKNILNGKMKKNYKLRLIYRIRNKLRR